MTALALVLAACERPERDETLAALADSSAAGYEVGVLPARAAADTPSAPAAGARGRSVARPPVATRSDARQASPAPAPARPAPDTPATAAATTPPLAAAPASSGTATAADASAGPAPGGPDSLPADSVELNPFAWYDARARVVRLQLVSGYNALNGSFNFNGGADGSHTLTVPRGWRVEVAFINRDVELAHSAAVVPATDPLPVVMPPPAFPGAYSVRLEQGIPDGASDTLAFATSTSGAYQIVCAVPGHAQSGMWMRLVISAHAGVPSYKQ